jgi:hypothetical protein
MAAAVRHEQHRHLRGSPLRNLWYWCCTAGRRSVATPATSR